MSNRISVSALQREFLLRTLRYRGTLGVNCDGGIGSTNPLLTRLIADGFIKLVRRGRRMEYTTPSKWGGSGAEINRTYAIAVDGQRIDTLICPACNSLCSYPHDDSTWRVIRNNHTYDCPVRTYQWGDRYDDRRKTEILCGLRGRFVAADSGVNYTSRQLKRRCRRDKIKNAKRLAKVKPMRKVELTVTYEQSIT